jgi:hypothetical protein
MVAYRLPSSSLYDTRRRDDLPGHHGGDRVCIDDLDVHAMTDDLFAMLLHWRNDPDEPRRLHAEYRLSLPDAVGYTLPTGYQLAPPESDADRARRLIAEHPPTAAVGTPCGACP